MKYYTVYREDTEVIIAFGNAVRCTEILGLNSFMLLYLKHDLDCENTIKW